MNFDAKKIKPEIGYYLAGFTDAEGCFCISLSPKRNENNKVTSWKVVPIFIITQKERHIIAQFKKHLKCGSVNTNEKSKVSTYTVTNLFSLREHIIPFFKKYNFQSAKKKRDFSNFIQVLDILKDSLNPSCLSKEEIGRIIKLRVNSDAIVSNRTYSNEFILSSLENTIHIEDPLHSKKVKEIKQSSETNTPNSERLNTLLTSSLYVVKQDDVILNEMIESDLYGDIKAENAPNFYIAGFADGDGSFNVSFRKRNDYSIGWQILPSFSIAQRDEILLQSFQKQLGCGTIRKGTSEGIYYLEVVERNSLINKVVPFFRTYSILSKYGQERYEKFCKILDLLSDYRRGSTNPMPRVILKEILELQRNEKSNSRYTSQQILNRFDEFALKRKNKTQKS